MNAYKKVIGLLVKSAVAASPSPPGSVLHLELKEKNFNDKALSACVRYSTVIFVSNFCLHGIVGTVTVL